MVFVPCRFFGDTQPDSSFHLDLHCEDLLDESKKSLNILLDAPIANPGGEEFLDYRRGVHTYILPSYLVIIYFVIRVIDNLSCGRG